MTNKTAYNAIINNAQKSNTGRMNAVIPLEMIDIDVVMNYKKERYV